MKNVNLSSTRTFAFLIVCIISFSTCTTSSEAGKQTKDKSYGAADWPKNHADVQAVSLENVEVGGYLGKRINRNLESLLLGLESPIPKPFEAAAKSLEQPKYRLAADSDLYKWLEGASYVYLRTGNDKLREEIDRITDYIIQVQEEDGYINAQKGQKKRWDPKVKHDLYIAGHLFEAAVAHFRATNETRLLEAASRWADYQIREYENKNEYFGSSAFREHSEYELGLLRLSRATKKSKYLDFSQTLARELCTVDGPTIADVSAGGGQHAVRVGYLLAGMADLYLETGQEEWISHLSGLWDYVNTTSTYATGAVGSHGEDYSKTPYDLPHERKDHDSRHLAETCASVAHMMFTWRMHAIQAEAKYFDAIEKTLYNHYLGAIALDGKGSFYYNPMKMVGDLSGKSDHGFVPMNARCMLPEVNRTSCCMTNCWRFMGALPEYLYSFDEEGIFVNLYSTSRVDQQLEDGRSIKLSVETKYPFDGNIKIAFEGNRDTQFKLRLRIPAWTEKATAEWPDQNLKEVLSGQYLTIDRIWSAGDTVELNFPMPVRLNEAKPNVEADAGQVTFTMGPLVYCLESEDISVPIEDVQFNSFKTDQAFTAEWRPELLEGIHQITVPGLANKKEIDLVLIPWFVRASRSDSARWLLHIPKNVN